MMFSDLFASFVNTFFHKDSEMLFFEENSPFEQSPDRVLRSGSGQF